MKGGGAESFGENWRSDSVCRTYILIHRYVYIAHCFPWMKAWELLSAKFMLLAMALPGPWPEKTNGSVVRSNLTQKRERAIEQEGQGDGLTGKKTRQWAPSERQDGTTWRTSVQVTDQSLSTGRIPNASAYIHICVTNMLMTTPPLWKPSIRTLKKFLREFLDERPPIFAPWARPHLVYGILNITSSLTIRPKQRQPSFIYISLGLADFVRSRWSSSWPAPHDNRWCWRFNFCFLNGVITAK